jgi:hypothetical protein
MFMNMRPLTLTFGIPHHNAPEFLRVCIEGIERSGRGLDYRIALVDSGSKPENREKAIQLMDQHSFLGRGCSGKHSFSDVEGTHSDALQVLYDGCETPVLILLDQDTYFPTTAWRRVLTQILEDKRLLAAGTADTCANRHSPMMLHPSCSILLKERIEDQVGSLRFDEGGLYDAGHFAINPACHEPYYSYTCKLLDATSDPRPPIVYLKQRQTKYGFGTVSLFEDKPVVYHNWYSGRRHTAGSKTEINGVSKAWLAEKAEAFLRDYEAHTVSLDPPGPFGESALIHPGDDRL